MSPPPQVDAARELRVHDAVRLVWWAERGYLHGLRRASTARARAGSGALAVLTLALWPLALVTQLIQVARPRVRYYLSRERDAVLAVRAHRNGWTVEDHLSCRPGTGRGAVLRAQIVPELLEHADRHSITISARAASPILAKRYVEELPGLIDIGPARPRGRLLIREPQPRNRGA